MALRMILLEGGIFFQAIPVKRGPIHCSGLGAEAAHCPDSGPSGYAETLFRGHNGVCEMCPSTWMALQYSQRMPGTVQYAATSRTWEENSLCLSSDGSCWRSSRRGFGTANIEPVAPIALEALPQWLRGWPGLFPACAYPQSPRDLKQTS